MSTPRVLVYDIETAPMLGYVWSLWENDVALNQLHSDWCILSWSAKWLNDDYVYYDDQRSGISEKNEKRMLKGLWKMLDEADAVITHNGKRFDEKKLNARFLALGLKPIGKKLHIDTKQIASQNFAFTSNKLEYLTDKFCVEFKKRKHAKFPGFKLWKECLAKLHGKRWKTTIWQTFNL
jgi:DNA polymerase elongation subunit (family B)